MPTSSRFAFTCGTWLMPTSAVVNPGTERANCSASVRCPSIPARELTNDGKFFVSCPCSSAALVTSAIPSVARRLHHRHRLPVHHLIRPRQRLRHRQVERQLHETEVVIVAGHVLRDLHHFLRATRYPAALGSSRNAFHVAMPYARIFFVGDGRFQKQKRLANAPPKFVRRHFAQLRFRIVQVEDVNRIQRPDFAGCARADRPGSPAPCNGSRRQCLPREKFRAPEIRCAK